MKSFESFVETFTPRNQLTIVEEQLYTLCPRWIFIFDFDQSQSNSIQYNAVLCSYVTVER